jgi:hypothetical protein
MDGVGYPWMMLENLRLHKFFIPSCSGSQNQTEGVLKKLFAPKEEPLLGYVLGYRYIKSNEKLNGQSPRGSAPCAGMPSSPVILVWFCASVWSSPCRCGLPYFCVRPSPSLSMAVLGVR